MKRPPSGCTPAERSPTLAATDGNRSPRHQEGALLRWAKPLARSSRRWLPRWHRLVLIGCASLVGLSRADTLTIAENGKATAVIVAGSDNPWLGQGKFKPGRTLSSAQMAAILAAHLEQMSGGKFTVVNDTDLGSVEVEKGRLKATASPQGLDRFILVGEGKLTRQCGLATEGLGLGGIQIKTLPNAVVIMGRSDGSFVGGSGTGNAVYQFLEKLGCRYLWPGELGKVIPHTPTIIVPDLDVRYSPPIMQRAIRFMPQGPHNFDRGLARLGMTREDYLAAVTTASTTRAPASWADWMCLGGNLGIVGGHAGYGLKGGWEKYGKTHPEWFALQPNGSRDQSFANGRWRVCTSNPGLIEQVAKTIIEEADKNPRQRCFSLAPNDGGLATHCQCEECRKLDPPSGPESKATVPGKAGQSAGPAAPPSMTDRYVHYWNAVAERVTKVHPDVLLTIDAYADYSTPPVREKLHPNLVLRYVPFQTDGWEGWEKAGAKRIFWRPNILHSGYRAGTLWVWAQSIVENARYLAANGMLAADVQGIYNNWATQGLSYYAMARILWNPKLTYTEILDDYCTAGFGAGAKQVEKFFLRAEQLRTPTPYGASSEGHLDEKSLMTPAVLDELKGYLRAAEEAVKNDDDAQARLAFVVAGMEYTARTAETYRSALSNPHPDAKVLTNRWASMKQLFSRYPLAVNVAIVAAFDSSLIDAFGDPGASNPRNPAPERKRKKSKSDDWMFEDQTKTKQ